MLQMLDAAVEVLTQDRINATDVSSGTQKKVDNMARNMENAAGVGLTLLIILQIPTLYSNMLPYPHEIQEVEPDHWKSKSMKSSAWKITGLALAIGFAGSLITQTPWPFIGTLAMVAYLMWQYTSCINYEVAEF